MFILPHTLCVCMLSAAASEPFHLSSTEILLSIGLLRSIKMSMNVCYSFCIDKETFDASLSAVTLPSVSP